MQTTAHTRRMARSGVVVALLAIAAACGSGNGVTAGDPKSAATGGPTWTAMPAGPLSPRQVRAAVWTGTEMLVLGGHQSSVGSGTSTATAAAAPSTTSAEDGPPPASTSSPTRPEGTLIDGAAYDPASRTWRSLPPLDVPPGLAPEVVDPTSGRLTVRFGGGVCAVDMVLPDPVGAWYDPAADRWVPIPRPPLPQTCFPSLVWSGGRLLAFTGADVARFDPGSATWTAIPSSPSAGWAPEAFGSAPVAVGDRVVAVGRTYRGDEPAQPYARLWDEPPGGEARWVELPLPPVEAGRVVPAGDGRHLYAVDGPRSEAAVLDVVDRTWRRLPDAPLPTRTLGVTVAAEGRLVVWGGAPVPRREGPSNGFIGYSLTSSLGDGAVYDAATDRWTAMTPSADAARTDAAAVVAGDRLLVWGGGRSASGASNLTDLGDGWEYGPLSVPGASGPSTTASVPTDLRPAVPPESSGPVGTYSTSTIDGATVGKLVDVYSVAATVPRGTSATDAVAAGSIRRTQIPQQFRPTTAINTTDEIVGKVALFELAPGTIVVQGMFVDPGAPPAPTATDPPPDPGIVPTTILAPTPDADGTVVVFMVADTIRRGTTGDAALERGNVREVRLPAQYRPATAIRATTAISGKVALFDMGPGTIVVTGLFVDP